MDEFVENQTFPAKLMNKYLSEKVVIFVNNKQLKGELLDLNTALPENENNMNLLYKTGDSETITVRNEIMVRLYEDQANMNKIRINDFEEGVKLIPKVRDV